MPGHAQARALADAFGAPIVSTSANRADEPPAVRQADAVAQFGELVDFVLDGEVEHALGASVIHDLDGRVLRSG